MEVLYFLAGISVVGIAVVFWLIKKEKNSEGKLFAKGQEKEEILAREFVSSVEEGPSFQEAAGGEEIKLSAGEEKKIEREIELMAQLDEMKEQNKNLDTLFKEKSSILEKTEELLESELRNRKEFNKLKDILEKELKESKDKSRELHVELSAVRAESEGYQRRVGLLEEKVAGLEKQIIQKDDEVINLTKRLQTFASPTTAATPPQFEAPGSETVVLQEKAPSTEEPLAPEEERVSGVIQETDKNKSGQPPLAVEEGNASLGESTTGFLDLSRYEEGKSDALGDQEKNSQNI